MGRAIKIFILILLLIVTVFGVMYYVIKQDAINAVLIYIIGNILIILLDNKVKFIK